MANFNYVSQVGSSDYTLSGAGTGSGAQFTGTVYSWSGNQTVTYTAGATGTLTYSLSIIDMMFAGATAYVQVNGSTIGGTLSISGTSSYSGTVSVTSGQTVYFFFNPGTDTSHMSYLNVIGLYITAAPTTNIIKPNRSYTTTNTPAYTNAGELSVNATDGKIWITNAAASALVLVSSLARTDHTGTLAVSSGGTGLATLTAENVILGNGTSAPTFVAPSTSGNVLTSNGTTWQSTAPAGGGGGTVTTASVVSANGFGGSVATATSTPAITITTSITGLLKGNATAISAATAGTDYLVPAGALGTPSSGTLTSCTSLPISTGVSGLGTSVATFLATPSSANLRTAITDETGTGGSLVFATSPTLTTATITSLVETKTAPSISSGTLTLNCSLGNVFAVSLNAAITTLTISNIPTTGNAFGITLAFTCDGTARAVTWPAAVKWAGGTAPTLTSTNAKVDIFVLTTWDGGTTWYAMVGGQNF